MAKAGQEDSANANTETKNGSREEESKIYISLDGEKKKTIEEMYAGT